MAGQECQKLFVPFRALFLVSTVKQHPEYDSRNVVAQLVVSTTLYPYLEVVLIEEKR